MYTTRYILQSCLAVSFSACCVAECWRNSTCNGPTDAAFPGIWGEGIYAPKSRYISPRTVLSLPLGHVISEFKPNITLQGLSQGLVFDFGIEVGGIVSIESQLIGSENVTLGLAFTEAKDYIGQQSDNSNGGPGPDGFLATTVLANGTLKYTMPDAKLRGGFRYLTLFLSSERSLSNTSLIIRDISLELAFQPTWPNLRAYQGYFHSSDQLLNKIWYSGAYTLQTNSVPGHTGRIPTSSREGWQNDEYIGPGNTVLLDGAKRDRWVWIGDMGTAVPSAFVSTGDMESTRNALLAIYEYQVSFEANNV